MKFTLKQKVLLTYFITLTAWTISFALISYFSITSTQNQELKDKIISFTYQLFAMGFIISLITIALIYFYLNRSFSSVKKIETILSQVAEHDLQVDLDYETRQDELGKINASINQVVLAYSGIITSIKYIIDTITSISKTLNVQSIELNKNSSQQSNSIQEITGGIVEISKSLQEISADFEGSLNDFKDIDFNLAALADSSLQIKNSMDNLTSISKVSSDVSKQGEESIQNVISSMGKIKEKTESITEFISIITEISDQTNLLSLNASIEAARAGEHGRGFAVVAMEVTKLAEKTLNSVNQVKDLIRDTNKAVSQGSNSVVQSSESLSKIRSNTDSILETVQLIRDKIVSQANNTSKISLNSNKQSELFNSVISRLNQEKKIISKIENELQNFSNSSLKLSEQVEILKEGADNLKNTSEGLESIVSDFKV
jgi:aerotaxis receptor